MLKSYFNIAWRNLQKNKTTSLINLFGLTVGLTTVFLIGLFVLNELQTDSGLPEQDRTYRVLRVSDIGGESYRIGYTSGPYAVHLEQDFPDEIEETVRVVFGESLVEVGEQRYQEDRYYYADPSFLEFFGFSLLVGDERTALSNPNSVVLTLETARKYFGSEFDAVGQTVYIDNEYDAIVTGVLDEIRTPSHLEFDLIESTVSFEHEEWWNNWWSNNGCTYVRLAATTNVAALSEQFPSFMDKYFGDDFERLGHRMGLSLQPISAVYFETDTRFDPVRHGNRRATHIFLVAALLLIVIACFNYVNLTTAKSVERSTEVGIYKVLGSGRIRIVMQMLGESFLLALFSVATATLLAWYLRPLFETAFDVRLQAVLSPIELSMFFVGTVLILTIMAGLYPGWLLSSLQIIPAIKGGNRTSGGHVLPVMRRVLVVFQFVLSIALLCSTLVIQRQLSYLQEKDLGFDADQVLIVEANNPDLYSQRHLFKRLLMQEAGVLNVTVGTGYPGGFHDATTIELTGQDQPIRMRTAFVDFDYTETYGLNMIAGRDFSEEFASDSTQVLILNERAVEELGLSIDEVIGLEGRLPMFGNEPRRVIGVVEDYHFLSLHSEMEPLVMSTAFWGRRIGIKAQAGQIPEVIAALEKTWNTVAPAYPFTFEFLDDRLNEQYTSEIRQGNLFGLFAGIAIFIACLGMFGLVTFASSLRTKEIGIRKVLGASISNIVALVSRDFLVQVAIAVAVATPVAYFAMQRWLESFAYRIDLGLGIFVLGGVLAVVVALGTISVQSIKVALSNPVDALRNE